MAPKGAETGRSAKSELKLLGDRSQRSDFWDRAFPLGTAGDR